MMHRFDLLPASYALKAAQRRNLGIVAIAGLGLALIMLTWWFMLGGQINSAKEDLAVAQTRNSQLQREIAELRKFDELALEVQDKAGNLLLVFQGDVAWPSMLNEVAMVTPGEVWLENLTTSAGVTEGAAPVGTETAEIRVADEAAFGRIQFTGKSTTMTGVGKWMMRLASVEEFQAVWLNSATKADGEDTVEVVDFDSTIELNAKSSALLRSLEELAGGNVLAGGTP
ncbi:MAG TPA: PilN domain-containing protein [Actinomycetota bacterium]|nr:PilN domain-containing protein [Actinomycetota bacterium]